jgi:hypothetical protein
MRKTCVSSNSPHQPPRPFQSWQNPSQTEIGARRVHILVGSAKGFKDIVERCTNGRINEKEAVSHIFKGKRVQERGRICHGFPGYGVSDFLSRELIVGGLRLIERKRLLRKMARI